MPEGKKNEDSFLEACRKSGPMDSKLVRGASKENELNDYHACAMRDTQFLQFSHDENAHSDKAEDKK